MVDLIATMPVEGLPLTIGAVEISLLDTGPMTSIAPFKGQQAKVEKTLYSALPKIGRSTSKAGVELAWFERGTWMMIGAPAPDAVHKGAAVTDQSDAWCALLIKGAGVEDVLARLVPVDLRQASVKRGHCLRSQLNHMGVHITRTGPEAFRIMGFRSMAHTLVHELQGAMKAVAARG